MKKPPEGGFFIASWRIRCPPNYTKRIFSVARTVTSLVCITRWPIPDLARRYKFVKTWLEQLLEQAAWQMAKQGVAAIWEETATIEFVQLVADPANATRGKLIEVYNQTGTDNKDLLL